MNRTPHDHDESLENDTVWKLLDQAPAATAGPRFADNTVRAARLAADQQPWWKTILLPSGLAAAATATAVLLFTFHFRQQPETPAGPASAGLDSPQAVEIQEIAETETLIAAVDHLDDFSDMELVSLIGF